MYKNGHTLPEKTRQVVLEALRYCETADRNLKVALIDAEQRVKQAKQEFLEREREAAKLSNTFAATRLSRIMELTNFIVNQQQVDLSELKPLEIEAIYKCFVPYVKQMKVIEIREQEFHLVKQKIETNAEIYTLYKHDLATKDKH
ncbi:diguanylate phosphodiesterase, putative [Babesia ovata]|uniref:Diguanylate phosphodiesterase, putative n=1 Tax=Babesia ovata TaxID=189622 RepID=A0A2H6K8R7_9APIC|nr:diguanylate phosphodiesterase, putative [Babesia ovata]GBE59387.1 diguanylate phosphodiesterase, putative [Babesia ovata]